MEQLLVDIAYYPLQKQSGTKRDSPPIQSGSSKKP